MITIEDFKKLEIRVGLIKKAERISESEKLLKLEVDFNEEEPRIVLAGIGPFVEPDNLIGKKYPFVTNLPPRDMIGFQSQAMIMAVVSDDNFSLLSVDDSISPGSRVS